LASIEENNLTLETMEYKDFDNFHNLITVLITKLEEIFPNLVSIRIGLRYVNQIKLDEEDLEFKDYINENLIKQLEFFDRSILIRTISSMEISRDDYNLIFKFGIPNSTYPNNIIRKEFVLDYDCYTKESLNKDEVIENVKIFKEAIKEIFENSIEDKLREKMNE
jgi:uncharacterized protein (TIGR04255 family)